MQLQVMWKRNVHCGAPCAALGVGVYVQLMLRRHGGIKLYAADSIDSVFQA